MLTLGRVRGGHLGITARQRPLPRRLVRFYRLGAEFGVEVMSVAPESPASRGAVREGDIMVAIDGHETAGVDHIHRFPADWPVANPVSSPSFADRTAWSSRLFPPRRHRQVRGPPPFPLYCSPFTLHKEQWKYNAGKIRRDVGNDIGKQIPAPYVEHRPERA